MDTLCLQQCCCHDRVNFVGTNKSLKLLSQQQRDEEHLRCQQQTHYNGETLHCYTKIWSRADKNPIKKLEQAATKPHEWLHLGDYFDRNCKQHLHVIIKCICGCQGDRKCSPWGTIHAWWCNYGRRSPPAQHPHIKARTPRFTCNGPHAMTFTSKGLHSTAPQTNKGSSINDPHK